jgi:AraC-like DNA-binding protein
VDPQRLIGLRAGEDGANRWRMARIAAPASLAGAIDGYCDYHETTPGIAARRELPHAEGVLIVNLGERIEIVGGDGRSLRLGPGEAFFAGPHLRPAISRSLGSQAGVHVYLSLSTLRRLIGAPLSEYVDGVAPLDAALGAQARHLGEALGEAPDMRRRVELLDAALARALAARGEPDRRQSFAVRLLRERPDLDIAAVADKVGWSRKHLADRVRDAVGVGPRCFRRLARFQCLLAAIGDQAAPDWPGLAHDAGYCDQSHMIREFREFSGMNPTAYLQRLLPDGGGLVEA